MSVESRGRSAGASVRSAAAIDTDTARLLDHLHRRASGASPRARILVAVAVVLTMIALAALLVRPPQTPPADGTGAVPIPWELCTREPANPCANLGPGEYLVPLAVPFTASLPVGTEYRGDGSVSANLILGGGTHLQVSVDPTTYPVAVTPPGDGEALAAWITSRPFVVDSTVTATTVSGRSAWQVDLRLADDADVGLACYYGRVCNQMLRVAGGTDTIGLAHTATPERWLVVSLPNARLLVIVVESLPPARNNLAALARDSDPVIRSLRFVTADAPAQSSG